MVPQVGKLWLGEVDQGAAPASLAPASWQRPVGKVVHRGQAPVPLALQGGQPGSVVLAAAAGGACRHSLKQGVGVDTTHAEGAGARQLLSAGQGQRGGLPGGVGGQAVGLLPVGKAGLHIGIDVAQVEDGGAGLQSKEAEGPCKLKCFRMLRQGAVSARQDLSAVSPGCGCGLRGNPPGCAWPAAPAERR